MKSILSFLEKLNPELKISKHKTVILSEKDIITYEELNLRANAAANYFINLRISRNQFVAIVSSNSISYIISVLALWIIDAIPVFINHRLTPSEIKDQIKFVGCKNILIEPSLKAKIRINGTKKINLDCIEIKARKVTHAYQFNKNKTALLMFTSGSTGKPKAVELTFSNLINSAKIGNRVLKQTQRDRWLASLPFYHIGGFSILFRALVFRTKIILPNVLKLESIIKSIKQFEPSLISLVSSQMKDLLQNNIQPNKKLRHTLLGGGFIDSKLFSESVKKGWRVSKVYGSNETSSFVTFLNMKEFKQKPESVGKAVPPNKIIIVDENKKELPNGSIGEIAVKSSSVVKQYFKDKKATRQRFQNHFYFTGDIGYKDSDEYLFMLNRSSDMIVTGGENVNPIEVEKVILEFSKVNEVCVFGIEDERWGQKIAAAIATKLNQQFTSEELRDFMKDKIAAFKIPKKIFFVDKLPRTELGKVRRESIKKMLV